MTVAATESQLQVTRQETIKKNRFWVNVLTRLITITRKPNTFLQALSSPTYCLSAELFKGVSNLIIRDGWRRKEREDKKGTRKGGRSRTWNQEDDYRRDRLRRKERRQEGTEERVGKQELGSRKMTENKLGCGPCETGPWQKGELDAMCYKRKLDTDICFGFY